MLSSPRIRALGNDDRTSLSMQVLLIAVGYLLAFSVPVSGEEMPTRPGGKIENPTGKYLCWEDYKIEINQYGGLGRDWPVNIVWEQFEILKKKAESNPEPPTTIKAVLLVCPTVEAEAYSKDGDTEVIVGKKTTSMTSAEVKWALEQWRRFAELVFVYSGGSAWLRTDVKVIDEALRVRTDKDWNFWSGPKQEFIDKYIPFERGAYHSYNSIYNSKDLLAGPWGGTFGAEFGFRGCTTSDNAWLSRGVSVDERFGFVCWHEWLNQCCWTTSNVLPYPENESLWNLYIFNNIGYREDPDNRWPWITSHRDVMRFILRPGMWKRWCPIDPYRSRAIEKWIVFGPTEAGLAREVSVRPASEGKLVEMDMDLYTHFNPGDLSAGERPVVGGGTYYFRTYVESTHTQEVRLWTAADERFQVWQNGLLVREGWGANLSNDQGRLIEKVTYVTLEKGVNTFVLGLPNTDDKVAFRMRFCKTDGSGEEPEGVTTRPLLDGADPLPLKEPETNDFKHPRLCKWADVSNNPWMSLPRLDQSALRDLTGIETLEVKTAGPVRRDENGQDYLPKQHLFFEVPKESVGSPWIAEPAEDSAHLNNDLDYNWKSVAWLRVPRREGPEKDILFLRFDVAEPLMHLLKTKGRPAYESIVGWMLVEHKIAYVVSVNLDLEREPRTELDLLSKAPE